MLMRYEWSWWCRVPDIVVARIGRWNIDVQHSSYVTDMPVRGLLAAAGHFGEGEDGVVHTQAALLTLMQYRNYYALHGNVGMGVWE